MTFINYAAREINCKIVYYGPGLGGKTTNIQWIHERTRAESKGKLISLATEPFRHEGPYDFGQSDLPARARERSMALVFDHGFWRPPPPETLFLQRKLGGVFLLCTRLRARVDASSLLQEALETEFQTRQEEARPPS